jgi:MoaA/NifB/PqqE/SkfB family radical SAM enzyme
MTTLDTLFSGLRAGVNRSYRSISQFYANRSLKAWKRLFLYYYRLLVLRQPVPRIIDIATTNRCQCRCIHCCAEAHRVSGKRELETGELKNLIDQAQHLGAIQVVFSGGEPLLRKDIVELVHHAHEAGMMIRLNTNGLLLKPRLVLDLKKAGLNICAVSIDDAEPEVHDRLRGVPGLYEKALRGVGLLQKYGIFFNILTYASKKNAAGGLEKIIKLGRQLGVLSVLIYFPVAVGRWEGAFDQTLTGEERGKVREVQDFTTVYMELSTAKSKCCGLEKSIFYISAYGDVTPCPVVPYSFGNIRRQSLLEIWRRWGNHRAIVYREDCPMNNLDGRKALKNYVDSLAGETG